MSIIPTTIIIDEYKERTLPIEEYFSWLKEQLDKDPTDPYLNRKFDLTVIKMGKK